MPARERPLVGKLQFKTKKELHLYTKTLLETKGICEIDELDSDYAFFLSLYSRKPSHQQYINTIHKFKIALDPVSKDKTNYMSCIDNKNKEYVFSWRSCCDGRDTKQLDKLKESCRTSIREQTSLCWHTNDTCFECKNPKTRGFEVDHSNEFSEIFKNFMQLNTIQVPCEFDSDPITSQYMFKQTDYLFEKSFQTYHEKHAILILLCNECHKKKTIKFISKKS